MHLGQWHGYCMNTQRWIVGRVSNDVQNSSTFARSYVVVSGERMMKMIDWGC